MAEAITPAGNVTLIMSMRGVIGMSIVFAVGFILLGLTKCGYDKIESIKEKKAERKSEVAAES